MSEETSQRVHAPTPQRREKARAAGRFPVSRDLVTVVSMFAGIVGLLWIGSSLASFFLDLTSRQLHGTITATPANALPGLWRENVLQLMRIAAPVAVALVAAPLLIHLVQTRFHLRVANLVPDLNRVRPHITRKTAGTERWSQSGLAAAKILAVCGVVAALLGSRRAELLNLMYVDIQDLGPSLLRQLSHVGLAVVMVLGGLAVADYFLQRASFERGLMMTTQELREEVREQNGDPEIAARRRAVRRQLVAQRGEQHDAEPAPPDASL